MIDSVKLTAQINQMQRVLVICPRRCGKGAFLCNYIDNQTVPTVFLALTGQRARDVRVHLNRRVHCGAANSESIRLPCAQAELIVVDEGLFMNERTLFPLFDNQRVVVLSSQSPDPTAMQQAFAAAGFVTIDAPLQ